MAPRYALALAAAASVALAQPGHLNHRHLHKRSTAPYSYSNGTVAAEVYGATGVETSTSTDADSTTTSTSTMTQYLTSTVVDYVTAGSGASTGSSAAAAAAVTDAVTVTVSAVPASSEQCGASIYITVTDTVTVTASASSSESEAASSASSSASSSLEALAGAAYAGYHHSYTAETSTSSTTSSTSTSVYVAPTTSAAPATTEEATSTSAAAPATTEAAETTSTSPAAVAPTSTSSTSTSTSSASESTSTSSSSGVQVAALSTKRGCLYNYEMYSGCSVLGAGATWVSWSANWASSSDWENATVDEYLYETKGSYVPQLWGLSSTYTEAWSSNAATIAEATAIMGYNEPDESSQSDISPTDAAAQWDLVYDYASSGITIISPCVTSTIASDGSYSGLTWLESFSEAGASWDATGLHFYADCTSSASGQVGYLEAYITEAYSMFSKPIWLTEFGCDSGATSDQIGEFMTAAVDYLESEANVAHYAAFMASDGYLLTDSTPNTAGLAYVAAKSS